MRSYIIGVLGWLTGYVLVKILFKIREKFNKKEMKWISVNDSKPADFQEVLVKTDCEDCPIGSATYFGGRFHFSAIAQCDEHSGTDEKEFYFFKTVGKDAVDRYEGRITHWISRQGLIDEVD